MFPDEDREENDDEHHERDDAAYRHRVLLALLGLHQVLHSFLRMLHRILHVVVDPVQDGALDIVHEVVMKEEKGGGNAHLVYHQHCQLFENGRQFFNGLGNAHYFFVALIYQLCGRYMCVTVRMHKEEVEREEMRRTSSTSSSTRSCLLEKPLSSSTSTSRIVPLVDRDIGLMEESN